MPQILKLITPTVVEDLVAGYISYTGNFYRILQFMLVSPLTSLPVSLVSIPGYCFPEDD
jgi:hypothetical protein